MFIPVVVFVRLNISKGPLCRNLRNKSNEERGSQQKHKGATNELDVSGAINPPVSTAIHCSYNKEKCISIDIINGMIKLVKQI